MLCEINGGFWIAFIVFVFSVFYYLLWIMFGFPIVKILRNIVINCFNAYRVCKKLRNKRRNFFVSDKAIKHVRI